MPSQRFLRLPKEKQVQIWEAAVQEFIAHPYDKVSINRIIRQAGISRGSFYTYFEDKRDLLSFILWEIRRRWTEFCTESLDETAGDFFDIMERLLDRAMNFCRNNVIFSLHGNLILYPGPLFDHKSGPADCGCGVGALFLEQIDRSRFSDPSDEGVALIFKMAAVLLFSTLSEFCLHPEKEEQIRSDFLRALGVLQRGTETGKVEINGGL